MDDVEKHLQINHSSASLITHRGLHFCRVYDTCVPHHLMGQHNLLFNQCYEEDDVFQAVLLLVTTLHHYKPDGKCENMEYKYLTSSLRRLHLTQHWEIGNIFFYWCT